MELLFITLIAVVAGIVAHAVTPGRDLRGAVLLPAIAAAATAGTWVSLTWAGLPWDGPAIWLGALAVAGLSAFVPAPLITRQRVAADEALLRRLAAG